MYIIYIWTVMVIFLRLYIVTRSSAVVRLAIRNR